MASDASVAHENPGRLTGYSIVNADRIDDAVAMAKGCPVLVGGGSVSVSETIDI